MPITKFKIKCSKINQKMARRKELRNPKVAKRKQRIQNYIDNRIKYVWLYMTINKIRYLIGFSFF